MTRERFRTWLVYLHGLATLPAAGALWSVVLGVIALLVLGVSLTSVFVPRAIQAAAIDA